MCFLSVKKLDKYAALNVEISKHLMMNKVKYVGRLYVNYIILLTYCFDKFSYRVKKFVTSTTILFENVKNKSCNSC